jgi:hypothetical protein
MSSSGQNTEDTRQLLEQREQVDYAAGRNFLGGAEEGLQGLNDTALTIQQQIAAARARAGARLAEQYPATWQDPVAESSELTGGTNANKPWAGITWGGTPGIKTKAQLQSKLGYGQSLAQWAKQHPDAWAKLI